MNDILFGKLQNFRAALNASTLEREHVVDGLLASILAKQNAFLLGPPGTGKSDLVRSVCGGINGANYFGYLLTPTTDPSELFGPVAVTKLLNDEYTRDVDGYLPSAHIAFMDELFRGSSAILNSLLSLLNERTFNNGKQVVNTPLQSIIAATNSWPQEESLQAFADRFLFRPTIEPLKKPTSKRMLDEWTIGIGVGEFLTLDDLTELQASAKKIKVSDDFLDKFNSVWQMLEQRSITISDRRRVQILKFLKAWAIVQGDEELYPDHMHNSIVHIVYNESEDQSTIKEILEQEIPTAERLFADAKRAASGIMAEFSAVKGRDYAGNLSALNEMVFQLRKYHKDMNTVKEKVDELLDSSRIRMSLSVRSKAVKLLQNLQNNCDVIAKALNEFSS
jgi:MoxR-like ATPase